MERKSDSKPPSSAGEAQANPATAVHSVVAAKRARAFLESFVHAYWGIIQVLATQRNMVVHCVIAIPTLIATQLLGFSPIENVVVLLCIVLVLACEIVNTAIEQLGDYVSPQHHPAIGRAKDAAAAMVLISAIGAAAIGVILFTAEQRLQRLLRWDVGWRWGGSIDNVMIKLFFLGICWFFVHAWIYRRRGGPDRGIIPDDEVASQSQPRRR